MRYYVDGVDPGGGPYCAPDHGGRRRLSLPDAYHLVELAPSESLREQLESCRAIRSALERGELQGRTRGALQAWANTPARQRQLAAAILLLAGRRLEEAEAAFAEAYAAELREPQAWGALAWLAADPARELASALPGGVLEGTLGREVGKLTGADAPPLALSTK